MEPKRGSSNLYSPEELDELFNVLANWEERLTHLDLDDIQLEPSTEKTAKTNLVKRLPS